MHNVPDVKLAMEVMRGSCSPRDVEEEEDMSSDNEDINVDSDREDACSDLGDDHVRDEGREGSPPAGLTSRSPSMSPRSPHSPEGSLRGRTASRSAPSLPFSISRLLGADFGGHPDGDVTDGKGSAASAAMQGMSMATLDLLRQQQHHDAVTSAITSLYSHPAVLHFASGQARQHANAGLVFAQGPAGVIRVPAHRPQGKHPQERGSAKAAPQGPERPRLQKKGLSVHVRALQAAPRAPATCRGSFSATGVSDARFVVAACRLTTSDDVRHASAPAQDNVAPGRHRRHRLPAINPGITTATN